jgi:alpha-ribazole phosphatase
MRVALVRHPRVQAEGLCYGRFEPALHADAVRDIAAICAALEGFAAEVLWTSPSVRCTALADALGAALKQTPRSDPRLLELDFGTWEGRSWDSLDRAALDRWAADPPGFAPPGGESGAQLLHRVVAFAHGLLAAGRDAVVVTHGGPLRLLPALLEGRSADLLAPAPPQGSITWVDV